jgi:tetratricopeptide (TPR) repeat protein
MLRIFLFLLLAVFPAAACLWDRDTLQEEAKGKLDTVRAITGWFDRYPAKYHEMRLDRVTKELAEQPDALDLYDDVGVACSRLGRHDEAIDWMVKKAEVLASKPAEETTEERYRYYSNLGTFLLIRWIVQPEEQRSTDLTDLKASEEFIKQALALNPDAHFGREKFQYMLIRWLLDSRGVPERGVVNFLYLDQELSVRPEGLSTQADFEFSLEEARKGITGLIQLGAAWESVDTFQTLQICLHSEESMLLAHLAYLRQKELHDSGKRSLHPLEAVRTEVSPHPSGGFHDMERIEKYFHKARAAAVSRDSAWISYQDERFAKGMHPDTHADFWKDWKEHDLPKMPGPMFPERLRRHPVLWAIGALVTLYLLQFPVRLISKLRKKTLEPAAA